MQILTRDGRYESRSAPALAPWGSTVPPSPGQVGMGVAGVPVNDRTAMQLAAVWGSVSLIANSIATLPIKQYRIVGGEPREMDPAPVIQRPWSEMDRRDFITQGSVSMLLRGNLWGRVASWDQNMNAEQVQLVHPDHARIVRLQSADGLQPAGSLQVRYWNEVQPWERVTRKMALSFPESLEGLNPIAYMRQVMGVAYAQDAYNGSFFANSAHPHGVIEVQDDLDEDEVKAMGSAWGEAHQGIGNAFKPAILTGGATWKPITMSLQDVQFLEQLGYSASVISGYIYRIPPHMVGQQDKDTSWGAGIEQQELGFVRNTLLIWLCRWEDLMTSWLPPRQFVTFDLSQRLRGDTLQRWSAYQIARVTGAMNNAEIRAAEGMAKVTDPDQAAILNAYDAPLNSAPMKPGNGGAGGDKAN